MSEIAGKVMGLTHDEVNQRSDQWVAKAWLTVVDGDKQKYLGFFFYDPQGKEHSRLIKLSLANCKYLAAKLTK